MGNIKFEFHAKVKNHTLKILYAFFDNFSSETLRKNSCAHSMEEKIFFDLNSINNALHIRVNFKKNFRTVDNILFFTNINSNWQEQGGGLGKGYCFSHEPEN